MVLTGFVAEIREKVGKGDRVPADAIINCASRRQMVKGYNRNCHNSLNVISKPKLSVAMDRLPSFFIHETSQTFS